jgi:hypothetical protein
VEEIDEASTEQRFAARNANLFNPKADENANEAHIFFDIEFRILSSELPCAAINTLVIAPVSNRHAEIVNDAAMAVSEPASTVRAGRDWGNGRHRHL